MAGFISRTRNQLRAGCCCSPPASLFSSDEEENPMSLNQLWPGPRRDSARYDQEREGALLPPSLSLLNRVVSRALGTIYPAVA